MKITLLTTVTMIKQHSRQSKHPPVWGPTVNPQRLTRLSRSVTVYYAISTH